MQLKLASSLRYAIWRIERLLLRIVLGSKTVPWNTLGFCSKWHECWAMAALLSASRSLIFFLPQYTLYIFGESNIYRSVWSIARFLAYFSWSMVLGSLSVVKQSLLKSTNWEGLIILFIHFISIFMVMIQYTASKLCSLWTKTCMPMINKDLSHIDLICLFVNHSRPFYWLKTVTY